MSRTNEINALVPVINDTEIRIFQLEKEIQDMKSMLGMEPSVEKGEFDDVFDSERIKGIGRKSAMPTIVEEDDSDELFDIDTVEVPEVSAETLAFIETMPRRSGRRPATKRFREDYSANERRLKR